MIINPPRHLTFGCEHELADWDASLLSKRLPGFGRDLKDYTIVNSNGVANDPSLRSYTFGGEINTPPSDTVQGQVDHLMSIRRAFPEAKINYRSNLHWHVRVPDLESSLEGLKAFAQYNLFWLPKILDVVEPIPHPEEDQEFMVSATELELKGAKRRYQRRRRSHHTKIPQLRVAAQMVAKTPERFFEEEVPRSKDGKVMWHAQARAAINMRQLLQTGTVEFRHFPGTLDPDKLATSGLWCKCYTECALSDWAWPEEANPFDAFLSMGGNLNQLPEFEPYDHGLEIRYRATCHDGTLHRHTIEDNIHAILEGTFNDRLWEQRFKW